MDNKWLWLLGGLCVGWWLSSRKGGMAGLGALTPQQRQERAKLNRCAAIMRPLMQRGKPLTESDKVRLVRAGGWVDQYGRFGCGQQPLQTQNVNVQSSPAPEMFTAVAAPVQMPPAVGQPVQAPQPLGDFVVAGPPPTQRMAAQQMSGFESDVPDGVL